MRCHCVVTLILVNRNSSGLETLLTFLPLPCIVAVYVWFVVPQASISLMPRKPKLPDEKYTFHQFCLVLTC